MGSINMRVLSLSLALCLVVTSAHPDYSDTWEEFKGKYGKEYTDTDEEDYRQNVWTENVRFISSHNAEYEDDLHDFSVGENEFADMTQQEITSYFNGLAMEESSPSGQTFYSDVSLESLPAEVDWSKHGCLGGLMDLAFKYVKDNGGIDTEASYNYTAQTGKKCLYNATNSGANLTSWVDIPHGSETDLQKAVGTVGPISVAIDASRPTFHFYKKGVYHDKKCSSERLDHGVLAVGYGSQAPPAGSDKKAKDYWLVKNSWGDSWGMAGYIKMARNKRNACGIATQASYPVV